MPIDENVLARIPGLGGYLAKQQYNREADLGELQAATGAAGLAQKMRENQMANDFRSGLQSLGPNPSEDQLLSHSLKYADPKTLVTTLENKGIRKEQIAATRERAMATLAQQAAQHEQRMEIARRNATTAEQKAAVDAYDKRFRQSLSSAAAQYNLPPDLLGGLVPPAPEQPAPQSNPPPAAVLQSNATIAPTVSPAEVMRIQDPQERAAAMAALQAGRFSPEPAQNAAPASPTTPQANVPPAVMQPKPAPASVAPGAMPPTSAVTDIPKPPGFDTWARAKQEKWLAQNSPTPGAGAMNEGAVKNAAWEKLLFGIDPKGMGKEATQQRAQIANERDRIGKELGLTPTEIAMMPQDNKIKMKAVDKLTTWDAFVGKSVDQLDKSMDLVIDYAKKLNPNSIQLINRAIIAGRREFNDPIANAYAFQMNTVMTEYARLISGPTSNAMLPVEAMKKGHSLVSEGLDVPSLVEMKKIILRDAAITKQSVEGQINSLRGSISSPRSSASSGSEPKRISNDAEFNALPSGAEFIAPDGSKRRKP